MSALLAIVSGFAGGVLLRSVFMQGWPVLAFVVLLFFITAVAQIISPRRFYVLGTVVFFMCGIGMLRTAIGESATQDSFAASLRQRVSYNAVVVGDPDVRDANQRTIVLVRSGNTSTRMLAVAPRYPEVEVGDHVFISGTLHRPETFDDESGRTFRYDKYLEARGVRYLLDFAYMRTEGHAPWYSIPTALARIKHAFLHGLESVLPEPYASLSGGIVIGGKSGLGSELQNAFIRSGLIPIIVLSGYNVMVVAEWVMKLLSLIFAKTKHSLRVSALAGGAALLLFVGIAGFSATSIRAAIMAVIGLYARATGRTYAAGRALLVTVLLMLMWNPLYLAFDPGFGLSVTATAGLIWLSPRIEERLAIIKSAFGKNLIATTLGAQAAVLPLLLYDTGNLSLVSIPANLLVLPLVPLAMGFAAFAGIVGGLFATISETAGIVLALPAYLMSAYFIWIARTASALPLANIILPPFSFLYTLIGYAVLIYAASAKRFSTTRQLRFAKNASM